MSRDLTFTIVFAAAMSILQTSQAANRELVDIAQVDPTIVIDLRYATEHNVTRHVLDPLVKQHLTLLQRAMAHNNFYGLRVEWWHFTTADWKKYVPYWEDKQMSQTGDAPAPKS